MILCDPPAVWCAGPDCINGIVSCWHTRRGISITRRAGLAVAIAFECPVEMLAAFHDQWIFLARLCWGGKELVDSVTFLAVACANRRLGPVCRSTWLRAQVVRDVYLKNVLRNYGGGFGVVLIRVEEKGDLSRCDHRDEGNPDRVQITGLDSSRYVNKLGANLLNTSSQLQICEGLCGRRLLNVVRHSQQLGNVRALDEPRAIGSNYRMTTILRDQPAVQAG